MKIVMLGTGYVGFVTGACFSEFGYEVIVPDQNIDFYCNGANWKEWYENVQKCFEKKNMKFLPNLVEDCKSHQSHHRTRF